MSKEYWGFIIALCVVAIIYFVSEMLHEEARENGPAWKWGDKQRRAAPRATWADHGILAALTFLADFVILKTIF